SRPASLGDGLSRITNQTLLLTAVPLGFLVLLLALALILQSRNAQITAQSQRSAQSVADADRAIFLLDEANRSVVTFQNKRDPSAIRDYHAAVAQLRATTTELGTIDRRDPAQE